MHEHEDVRRSHLSLELMPAVQRRRLDLSVTHTQPVSLSELQRFTHLVVCDGRFLEQVGHDPSGVAKNLGLDLPPEAEAQFRRKPLHQHLIDLWAVKYPGSRFEAVSDYVILVVLAVALAIAAIAIIDIFVKGPKRPVDRSPHAHLKL